MDIGSFGVAGFLLVLLALTLGIAIGRYAWPMVRETAAGQAAQLEAATLRGRVEGLIQQLQEEIRRASFLDQQLGNAASKAKDNAAEIGRLTERERSLMTKVDEQATQLFQLAKIKSLLVIRDRPSPSKTRVFATHGRRRLRKRRIPLAA